MAILFLDLIKYDYSNCTAPVGLCQTNSVNIISYVTLSVEEHNGMLWCSRNDNNNNDNNNDKNINCIIIEMI